jgi:hypothetical protein
MSNTLIHRVIGDFVTNHESLQDYTDVLDDLFTHYVKSDVYASLIRERRENLVNVYHKLKSLITRLIDVKENG